MLDTVLLSGCSVPGCNAIGCVLLVQAIPPETVCLCLEHAMGMKLDVVTLESVWGPADRAPKDTPDAES